MTRPPAERRLQPLLHDLTIAVMAPTSVLSDPDGQIRGHGTHGVFHADRRALSRAVLRLNGFEPEAVMHGDTGPGRVRFTGLARRLGDDTPDPTVRVDRHRVVAAGSVTETVTVTSTAAAALDLDLTVDTAGDLATMPAVKAGDPTEPIPPRARDDTLRWTTGDTVVTVTAVFGTADADGRLRWRHRLEPGGSHTVGWRLTVTDPGAVVAAPTGDPEWHRPTVTAGDHRLVRLLNRSLDDLHSLRLADPLDPSDSYLAAGVPWFLTLFGRDSLWAARMMLPLGTELAAGTLRTLARRQGRRLDPRRGEAPGKILHELRADDHAVAHQDFTLPAAYYGTIDATLLWIGLLHDAWRWGMPDATVTALLPHLDAALDWLAHHADPDGDSFVEYRDTTGSGLANQGWKDSGDAIRFGDGAVAAPPIALAEVQGYAHAAARDAAALLAAFDRPGADRWLDHADRLARRFRDRFWLDGPDGPFPAVALDGAKRPVDTVTSNIAHLLGTGILSAAEEARVAEILAGAAMSDGFGLRTMASDQRPYSPLSYHCGSIWPHDTAVAVAGLAAAGHPATAARLADGLLTAAESWDFRLPELFGGDRRADVPRPVPYPAACRPQAWSAAAAVAILHAATGLVPDVPAGRVRVRPLPGTPWGPLRVDGLRVATATVGVDVTADGQARISGLPAELVVER